MRRPPTSSDQLPGRTCTRRLPSSPRRAGRALSRLSATKPGSSAAGKLISRARPDTARSMWVRARSGMSSSISRKVRTVSASVACASAAVACSQTRPSASGLRGAGFCCRAELQAAEGAWQQQVLRHRGPVDAAGQHVVAGRQLHRGSAVAPADGQRPAIGLHVAGPAARLRPAVRPRPPHRTPAPRSGRSRRCPWRPGPATKARRRCAPRPRRWHRRCAPAGRPAPRARASPRAPRTSAGRAGWGTGKGAATAGRPRLRARAPSTKPGAATMEQGRGYGAWAVSSGSRQARQELYAMARAMG